MISHRNTLFLFVISAVILLGLNSSDISRNIAFVFVNHALSTQNLAYAKRQSRLDQAALWAKNAGAKSPIIMSRIHIERQELQAIDDYLRSDHEWDHLEPGPQLLSNPNFANNVAGWIQYRSEWQQAEVTFPEYAGTALVFNRHGPGHGSLSQILELKPETCYLFKTVGAVERYDDTRTFWLYWERFENGVRQGHHLDAGAGDQVWAERKAVFCLPPSDLYSETVVIAPASVYGDATVYLLAARLYELQLSR